MQLAAQLVTADGRVYPAAGPDRPKLDGTNLSGFTLSPGLPRNGVFFFWIPGDSLQGLHAQFYWGPADVASWDSLVSPLDAESKSGGMSWIRKLDPGNLKVKLAGSIVAISSIHLLQVFLNASHYTEPQIMWQVIMHITFVVSALMLGVLDKIMAKH